MKKIVSVCLVVGVLLCFVGCGDIAQTANFSRGTVVGNVYKSEFMGLGCELPDGWTFYTDEQIAELNGMTLEALSDETSEQLQSAQVIYEMYASSADGSSININFENLGIAGLAVNDAADYVEIAKENVVGPLEEMGFTNVTVNDAQITVGGTSQAGLDVVCEVEGIVLYESLACIKVGNYVATITVASLDEATVDEVFSLFYALSAE